MSDSGSSSGPTTLPMSPLLRLPDELRNMIYKHALFFPDRLHFQRTSSVPDRESWTILPLFGDLDGNPFALSLVCKQLRQETYPLVFKLNELHFRPQRFPGLRSATSTVVDNKDTDRAYDLFLRKSSITVFENLGRVWLWYLRETRRTPPKHSEIRADLSYKAGLGHLIDVQFDYYGLEQSFYQSRPQIIFHSRPFTA